jgi:transcriptional regulator with XRE-family HTH domain
MDRPREHQALALAIRERRAQLGLSQERVALDTGLQRKTVYQLENALTSPRLSTLLAVANELGALADLLRRAGQIAASYKAEGRADRSVL